MGCTLGGTAYLTPTGRCPLTTSAPRGCLAPTALEALRATEVSGQHEEAPTRALGGCLGTGPQEERATGRWDRWVAGSWRLKCWGNVGSGGTVSCPCRRGGLGSGRGQGSPVCPLREKSLSETPDEGGGSEKRVEAQGGKWGLRGGGGNSEGGDSV